MDHAKKLAFVSHMTAQALNSLAQTPNQMSPKGEMSHDKKMDFVAAMTKHGLKHFDTGGGVVAGTPSTPNLGSTSTPSAIQNNSAYGANAATSPFTGSVQGLAEGFTTQNNFVAQAPTSVGVVGAQQAGLANELQNESAGGGPNPAQIQYQQNINDVANKQATNYAQNRALNPGLAARLSGNTGAALESNAASTSAMQQAEQQLAAQQELEGLTGQEQQGALSSQAINSQIGQNNANAVNATEGGIFGGLSGTTALSSLAKGGEVKKMAKGGTITSPYAPNLSNADFLTVGKPGKQATSQPTMGNDQGGLGGSSEDYANGFTDAQVGSGGIGGLGASDVGGGAAGAGIADDAGAAVALAAKGGQIHKYPDHIQALAEVFHPGHFSKTVPKIASMDATGGKVKALAPKERAVKKDNSYSNDKVPALLSEGEIVIPRSVTQHPMAPEKAAEFVARTLAKKKMVKR